MRVGLNSGTVVVRAIGNDLHMDYSAVGQTTHLAARMDSVEKSRATLARRLADHLQKLEAIRQAGGHVSSVEREIHNFQQQIAALDNILRREP
jgi:class 3 adenylate cyclase